MFETPLLNPVTRGLHDVLGVGAVGCEDDLEAALVDGVQGRDGREVGGQVLIEEWVLELLDEPGCLLGREDILNPVMCHIRCHKVIAKVGVEHGGVVSEVSLVDFPANPTTGFKIADATGDVQKVFTIGKAAGPEANEDDPAPKDKDTPEDETDEETPEANKVATPEAAYCGDEECEVCKSLSVEKKKLTSEERNDLPDSDFVFPKERKYPIPDKCLIAETLIDTVDEGPVPIGDLVGREVEVLAYDVDAEQVVFGRASNIRLTLQDVEVVRVELDNGATITCTPNHPFMLRDGTYRAAGNLQAGDRLMPSDVSLLHYDVENGIREGKSLAGGDGLGSLTGKASGRGAEVSPKASRGSKESSSKVSCHSLGGGPKNGTRSGSSSQAYSSVQGSPGQATGSLQGEAEGGERSSSRAPLSRHLRVVRNGRIQDRVGPLPRAGTLSGLDLRPVQSDLGDSERFSRAFGEDGTVSQELAEVNHRVVSVSPAGRADTYDMEVEKFHNFGLTAGVFVHNSHARNALARVAQHGTEEEKKKVRAAVHAKYPDIEEGDDDKGAEPEVTKTETPDAPETEAHGPEDLLAKATKLAEEGKMEEAIKALQAAADANLAKEATTSEGKESTPVPDTFAPAVKKSLNEYALGTQYRLRQLHDALCPVYGWEQVAAAHPQLAKNGVAAALGPSATHLLYQMLSHEVSEDGGTGKEVSDIRHIACAYFDLLDFLGAEAAEQATPVILRDIRADLHKAFEEDYPNVHLSPLTFDASDADHFRRSYIRDGRTPAFGSTTHVKLPSEGKEVEGSDFQRAPLTADRERPAPGGEGNGVSVTKAYEDDDKESIRATMTAVHDHLAAQFPELCCSGPASNFDLGKTVGDLYQRWGDSYAENVLGANPTLPDPAKLDTHGALHQGIRDAKANSEWPDSHGIEASPVASDGLDGAATTPPASVKATEPTLDKLAMPDETKALLADVKKQVQESFVALTSEISGLAKRLEAVESQADPAQAPWRGAVAGFDRLLKAYETKSQSVEAVSTVDKLGFEERKEKVEYLIRLTQHHDNAIREGARS